MEDTQYFGAIQDTGASTVEDCQQACSDAGSDCSGFGFNTNANECWIHAQVCLNQDLGLSSRTYWFPSSQVFGKF